MSYQDREDIDKLLKTVEDLKYYIRYDDNKDDNQLVATLGELESLANDLSEKYYDKSETYNKDELYNLTRIYTYYDVGNGSGTLRVYKDSLYVTVVITGTFKKDYNEQTITTHGSSQITTIPASVSPKESILSPSSSSYNNYSKVRIASNGKVYIINATSDTDVPINTMLVYPLTSRFP